MLDRFGKSQYEALIRQLFRIRRASTVQEYIDKFSELVDQLLAYAWHTDPLFFAMRFMDGLRDDIRNVVHMQRPNSFDEACVLALLQEELLESTRCKEGRRPATFTPNKFAGVRPTVAQTPLTKLHRRLELSVVAVVLTVVLKIDLTLSIRIVVAVVLKIDLTLSFISSCTWSLYSLWRKMVL